jgi:hypothetical protein
MYSQLPDEKQEYFSARLHRLGNEFMGGIMRELGPDDGSHISTIPAKVAELAEEWERIFQRICSSEVVTDLEEVVDDAIIGDTGIAAIDAASVTIARENTEAPGP